MEPPKSEHLLYKRCKFWSQDGLKRFGFTVILYWANTLHTSASCLIYTSTLELSSQICPTVVAFNTTSSACAKKSRWQQCLWLLEEMQKQKAGGKDVEEERPLCVLFVFYLPIHKNTCDNTNAHALVEGVDMGEKSSMSDGSSTFFVSPLGHVFWRYMSFDPPSIITGLVYGNLTLRCGRMLRALGLAPATCVEVAGDPANDLLSVPSTSDIDTFGLSDQHTQKIIRWLSTADSQHVRISILLYICIQKVNTDTQDIWTGKQTTSVSWNPNQPSGCKGAVEKSRRWTVALALLRPTSFSGREIRLFRVS